MQKRVSVAVGLEAGLERLDIHVAFDGGIPLRVEPLFAESFDDRHALIFDGGAGGVEMVVARDDIPLDQQDFRRDPSAARYGWVGKTCAIPLISRTVCSNPIEGDGARALLFRMSFEKIQPGTLDPTFGGAGLGTAPADSR